MQISRYKPSDQKVVRLMNEVEALMNAVKIEYELYFLQQSRIAPSHKDKQLGAKVRELDRHFTTNTQLKFKRNALRSRYGALRTQWDRIMGQIEAGTYHRHRVVADRHEAHRMAQEARMRAAKEASQGDAAPPAEEPVGASPAAAAREAAGAKRRIKLPKGVYSEGSSKLYKAFAAARQETGEGTSGMDERKLKMALKQHAKAVKARTGVKHVAFRVAVEDGKTRVKVIPIRE